jgi:hypothetical protein
MAEWVDYPVSEIPLFPFDLEVITNMYAEVNTLATTYEELSLENSSDYSFPYITIEHVGGGEAAPSSPGQYWG